MITIQNIEEGDLKEIRQIGLSTPELHVTGGSYYYQVRELKNFIKSPNDIYLAAKVDGKLAGYRLATFNPYLKEAYLIDIVVKPEYRNLGIANMLYKETFKILKKKGCIWAWALVKDNNERMKAIIQKKGFKPGATFTFFYKVDF